MIENGRFFLISCKTWNVAIFSYLGYMAVGTVRWIVLRLKKEKQQAIKLSFLRILLVNVLAPVTVSLILFYFIGDTTVSLISIPILGGLSASVNI